MRKMIRTTTLLLLVLLVSCGGGTAGYTISVEADGLGDGTVLELVPVATHKNLDAVAKATVTDGKAVFTGTLPEPRMMLIKVPDSYGGIKLLVESGRTDIRAKVSRSERDGVMIYEFSDVQIEGNPLHELYLQKTKPRDSLDSLHSAFQNSYNALNEQVRQAREEGDETRVQEILASPEWEKVREDEANFFSTVEEIMNSMFLSNKDNWWGPMLMLDQTNYLSEDQRIVYEQFSPEAKESYYGKLVFEELYPETIEGKPFYPIVLQDEAGNKLSVAEAAKGKKYVLIDFWASWCGPCRKEIPNLKNLYSEYSGQGFEIISISIDRKKDDWEKALEEEQLPWPNYLDTTGAADMCDVTMIPAMFLLDSDGMVVAINARGEKLQNLLSELF